ncbi:MAG: MarR family winged helix-turn-helix transcriptional regulator [Alphaproteobacteria bacterium]|nr:MarR family winged helix-turn-helix transcriptional regulator [Alphaproteobacteria bacterium]
MRTRKGGDGLEHRLELDSFVPYRLSVLQQEVSRLIATAYAEEYGLMRHDWRVMAALGNDQPLSANEVCDRTNMDKVQVSRAISRLLGRGLVARVQDGKDRRRWILRLTASGEEMYRNIVPAARAREAELLAALSESELGQLDALIDKLYRRASHLLRRGG